MSQPFVLGVNYWPRRKAMYWWSDFDAGEVRDEFALIKDLGLSVVRMFLLWDDFQPTPDTVSTEAMKHLAEVCAIAADNGLGLDMTFFTGHMSGPNWAPGWMLERDKPLNPGVRQLVSGGKIVDCGYRNYYVDTMVQDAQRLLLRTVVNEFKDHPAIWMWNLGNEPDLFAFAPDQQTGTRWIEDMTRLIKSIDPVHPVTCGLHVASLHNNRAHHINEAFGVTDVAVMHSYPMYLGWSKAPLDTDLVPYTCALTSALCGKPTLMEEFGGCMAGPGEASYMREWISYADKSHQQFMASEEDFAEYITAVLPKLVEVGSTGAMVWCFADYIPELWDKPPCSGSEHERFFGLVRPDGSIKPHAEAMKKFAATHPTVQPATRTITLDITPEEFYQSPTEHTVRLYDVYLNGG